MEAFPVEAVACLAVVVGGWREGQRKPLEGKECLSPSSLVKPVKSYCRLSKVLDLFGQRFELSSEPMY
jgi:hypothetical protein